jgi:hypothetical protein
MLTRNPNAQSVSRGWDLMAICLSFFPPQSSGFDNYLFVFLRQYAQPREKFIGALYKIMNEAERSLAPTLDEVQKAPSNLVFRSRGFSEPLPPAAPSYIDLTVAFVDVDDNDVEFQKRTQVLESECQDWIAAQDPASKQTYYYNQKTGESQWEMPESMRSRRQRTGSRI